MNQAGTPLFDLIFKISKIFKLITYLKIDEKKIIKK